MELFRYLMKILDHGRMAMNNRYRLTSTVYERELEKDKVDPLKIYFISVEGNVTEKEYFDGISKYRDRLLINDIGCNLWKLIVEMQSFENKE